MIKISELLRKLWSLRSCFNILPPGALTPQGIEGVMKRDVSKHWCTLQWCASRGWFIAHENWTSWFQTAEISLDSGLNTVKLLTGMMKKTLGSWIGKLPADINCIHFICHFHQFYGINATEYLLLQHFISPCKWCWDIWLSLLTASFWSQWTECTVCTGSPEKQRNWKLENVCYKTN